LNHIEQITPKHLSYLGYDYNASDDKWNISDQAVDFLYLGDKKLDFKLPGTLQLIGDNQEWIYAGLEDYRPEVKSLLEIQGIEGLKKLNTVDLSDKTVLVFTSKSSHAMAEIRSMFLWLSDARIKNPVVIKKSYKEDVQLNFQLYSGTDLGALFLDGFGDGIWLEDQKYQDFGILQATRTRISKTDYISCPSCGRTLFDLQETTEKIRSKTNHLKGLKIGIMGCIVNGPGEMADADYGYVGSGVGKITLYKGQEVVEKGIDSEKAVDALINLIKSNGDWRDLN
jgi:(E)-4-hydroxy-3-methylbut-2-enyl-diphosphate synthase